MGRNTMLAPIQAHQLRLETFPVPVSFFCDGPNRNSTIHAATIPYTSAARGIPDTRLDCTTPNSIGSGRG